MEKRINITAEEREKCRKVADAFAELYEMAEIMVLDADRHGFVMLKHYELSSGFAEAETYTDSEELFDALWEEWLNTKLYLMAKEMKLEEIHYEEVFDSLGKQKMQQFKLLRLFYFGNCLIRYCFLSKVKDLLRIYML